MAEALRAPGAWYRAATRRITPQLVVFVVTLGALGFMILYPVGLLFSRSFDVGQFGTETVRGLDNWRDAVSSTGISSAIWNTVTLSVAHVSISLVVALAVAWLLARTNLPGRGWLEFGFWIAYFLPSLTVTLGWILMFDGQWGIANERLARIPWLSWLQFDIFSWWGIVFAHLMTTGIAIKVMLITPLLRNLDASHEEASMAAGASRWHTFRKIVLPSIAPGVAVVALLSVVKAIEAFEIELVLGSPRKIDVFSTLIYRYAQQSPPEYGTATAMAMMVLFLIVPLILLQQYLARFRSSATVTGKHAARVHDLGRWRWPAFAFVFLLVVVLAILPAVLVVMSTFMKIFGVFDVEKAWTLEHWRRPTEY